MDLNKSANLKKDDLLNLVLTHLIEPSMQKDILYVVYNFPPSQAALAKTSLVDDLLVAERFEFYFNGLEIANGYHELKDKKEVKKRLQKVARGKYPLDKDFVSSLDKYPFDLYGVSVGFDRLMILRHNKGLVDEVLPFSLREN